MRRKKRVQFDALPGQESEPRPWYILLLNIVMICLVGLSALSVVVPALVELYAGYKMKGLVITVEMYQTVPYVWLVFLVAYWLPLVAVALVAAVYFWRRPVWRQLRTALVCCVLLLALALLSYVRTLPKIAWTKEAAIAQLQKCEFGYTTVKPLGGVVPFWQMVDRYAIYAPSSVMPAVEEYWRSDAASKQCDKSINLTVDEAQAVAALDACRVDSVTAAGMEGKRIHYKFARSVSVPNILLMAQRSELAKECGEVPMLFGLGGYEQYRKPTAQP